ncbi:DUF4157 domain-containing protein [Streptomyces sp. NPDC058257]|uniref:eCIS core domain-containing protein n=1 Tax=Streptomyces sp. NPDC058257 TaxID=3346409 RepID=UPI0036E0B6D5
MQTTEDHQRSLPYLVPATREPSAAPVPGAGSGGPTLQRSLGNGYLQRAAAEGWGTGDWDEGDGMSPAVPCGCGGGCAGCGPSGAAQPKLTVGPADDAYEREADRIAERITGPPGAQGGTPLVRRRVSPDAGAPGDTVAPTTGGQPLSVATRAFMEPRFGHDFGRVRVHTDAGAAASARAVHADAYTLGHHLVFAAGRYAPETSQGQRLLAHELTHVVQQTGGTGPAGSDSTAAGGPSATAPVVQRKVTADGVQEARPRYSYSTHCGWIDWGHVRPDAAELLISQVRAASAVLSAEEAGRSGQPGHHAVRHDEPGVGVYEDCPGQYAPGERAASARPRAPLFERTQFPNHTETDLYGFEVGQSDPALFAGALSPIAAELAADPKASGEIYGFSDCMGVERANVDLRAARALAALRMFPEDLQKRFTATTFASAQQYLASNTHEEGRRRNRAVAIKILRPLPAENVIATQRSAFHGVTVNAASVISKILQPLTPDQVLRVSLAIFMAVSTVFEETQGSTDFLTGSSFSEEDLPSNLISFYVAANHLSYRTDVEKICDVWDPTRSLAAFQGYTFGRTRYTFKQTRLPAGGAWPTQFDAIQPEPPGRLWQIGPMTLIAPGSVQYVP